MDGRMDGWMDGLYFLDKIVSQENKTVNKKKDFVNTDRI